MGAGFNSNTYRVLKSGCWRDVFERRNKNLKKDELIGSAIANAIIVEKADREEVYGLEGQSYIDKMVELGYIALT